jgi:Zn-dependent M32 family carboxypeptidase
MNAAFTELEKTAAGLLQLDHMIMLLHWDQRVNMPPGGQRERARQVEMLDSLRHQRLTDRRTGELIDAAWQESLDPDQRAGVRELRREYDRATRLSPELVQALARAGVEGYSAWSVARPASDFCWPRCTKRATASTSRGCPRSSPTTSPGAPSPWVCHESQSRFWENALGSVYAAALFAAAEKDLGGAGTGRDQVKAGEPSGLLDWLRRKVHSRASLVPVREVISDATGMPAEGPVDTTAFVAHLRERYL